MNLAVDIIIIIVVLLIIWLAYRRGFIKSIMGFVSTIVSLIVAYAFYPNLTLFIKEKFLIDSISGDISTTIQSFSAVIGNNGSSGVFNLEKLADGIVNNDTTASLVSMLQRYGQNIDEFVKKLRSLANASEATVNDVNVISEDVASPTATSIASIISFILIFVACILVFKLITYILDKIFKMPVLNFANKLLGVLFGILEAAVIAYVLSIILSSLVTNLGVIAPSVFGTFNIDDTYVCKFLLEHNPIDYLLKLFNKGN